MGKGGRPAPPPAPKHPVDKWLKSAGKGGSSKGGKGK